jgi:hypothetical protein
MNIKLNFKKSTFRNKNDFSLKILPTIWMIHNSTERQKEFAINHNKKTERKIMYDYTSIYFSWIIWSLILTLGKE